MTKQQIQNLVLEQDWSLTDTEIARRSGVAMQTVRRRRILAGIPLGKGGRKSKWDEVDWSKDNAQIAAERNVTRQCVYQYRKRFAALAASV